MLRSLPDTLLKYTREGVLIRARYLRQLNDIDNIEQAVKRNAKKQLSSLDKQLTAQLEESKKQAYGEGLEALLGDILTLCTQYHTQLFIHEMKQQESLVNAVAQYFQSPEIQVELTKQLIAAVPTEEALTLKIPKTLQHYVEKALNDQSVKIIPHDETTLSVSAGSQVVFFDPQLLMHDLKTQFHQPYSEQNRITFSHDIKAHLLDYIAAFDEDAIIGDETHED